MAQWRVFFHRPTQQLLQVVFGTGGTWSASPGVVASQVHLLQVAQAFGVRAEDLQAYEGDGSAEIVNQDIGALRVPVMADMPPALSVRPAPPVVPGPKSKLDQLEERVRALEQRP